MSLEKGLKWQYQDLNFKGYSLAGLTTSMMVEGPKVCFDIAQGLPFNIPAKLFCLTHMHADHGSGLNYVLTQRSLFQLPPATIMLPKYAIDSVNIILKEWQKLQGFEYSYDLIGVDENTERDVSPKYKVKSFPTTHTVDSFGYMIFEKKKKLKQEFQGLERQQILDLKSQGKELEENIEIPAIAFTGDTQIEFIKDNPSVRNCKLLFMECTYLDEKRSTPEARKWGHIHLDEIIENIDLFDNEHISLIHLSSRYSTGEAERILKEKLPLERHQQFSIFPRPL